MTPWMASTASAGALKSGELETTPPIIVWLSNVTCRSKPPSFSYSVPWYVFPVVQFVGILVCFPGCTICWYLGTFSRLYNLLVSWYVFLVVHFVCILVCFPGCTPCWYLGTYFVHFVGILVYICFPGCIPIVGILISY